MALTIQQFGAKIKAKYSQYSDMSDAEVGQKMLAKYPQYQDMVETREQKISRYNQETEALRGEAKKAGSLGSIVKETAKGLPKAALEVGVGTPAKFLASAGEVLEQAMPGKDMTKATQRTYDLPGLQPFKSYQSEAETRAGEIVEGKKSLASAAIPFASVPLAGVETLFLGSAVSKGVKAVKNIGSFKNALKMIVPQNYSQLGKKGAESVIGKAGKPGGAYTTALGKIKVKPSATHIKQANVIAPYVKSGNPIKTADNIGKEITRYSEKVLTPFLKNNKTPIDVGDLTTFLNKNAKPTELIRTTNSKVFNNIKNFYIKNLDDVVDNYTLWQKRIKLDQAFKKEYGEALYNPLSPQHGAVKEAYYTMRNLMNKYLIDTASPVYKPAMERLSLLEKSLKSIKTNYSKTIGKGVGAVGKTLETTKKLAKQGIKYGTAYYALRYLLGKKY